MKITLSLHGPLGASLSVESDRIDDIAHAYVSVLRLTTSGVLPPLQLDGPPLTAGPNAAAVDAGVERPVAPAVPSAEDEGDAVVPETPVPTVPERETEKPGKSRKARASAKAKAKATPPAEEKAEPAAPPAEEKTEVTRAAATAALREVIDEFGEPGAKKVLQALGVERFGLYVRDEGQYHPVLEAIAKLRAGELE